MIEIQSINGPDRKAEGMIFSRDNSDLSTQFNHSNSPIKLSRVFNHIQHVLQNYHLLNPPPGHNTPISRRHPPRHPRPLHKLQWHRSWPMSCIQWLLLRRVLLWVRMLRRQRILRVSKYAPSRMLCVRRSDSLWIEKCAGMSYIHDVLL